MSIHIKNEESHIIPITLDDDGELMITFPDELMDSLNWKAGDVVEWIDGGNGEWIVRKLT
jgi:bifunctional DNA-binding transcriptional regulator/antitoxin component of YhaV-PrlF toxin-antitoxin module